MGDHCEKHLSTLSDVTCCSFSVINASPLLLLTHSLSDHEGTLGLVLGEEVVRLQ